MERYRTHNRFMDSRSNSHVVMWLKRCERTSKLARSNWLMSSGPPAGGSAGSCRLRCMYSSCTRVSLSQSEHVTCACEATAKDETELTMCYFASGQVDNQL